MSKSTRANAARSGAARPGAARPDSARPDGRSRSKPKGQRSARSLWLALAGGLAGLAVVAVLAVAALSGGGTWTEQGKGGSWTNITPDTLAAMMTKKDFTLLNVKTPYVGEIPGTDLYIPYTDLTAQAGKLPTDKTARIVVYCRSGNESRMATQTLLNLGYTNIMNLDKGLDSWAASGRSVIQKNRA